jgi:hypothetical protein
LNIQEKPKDNNKTSSQEPTSSQPTAPATPKRTLSDRSPQLSPTHHLNRPTSKPKLHNLQYLMNPTPNTNFGPATHPSLSASALVVNQPLDFGLPSNVPEWFQPIQTMIFKRFAHIESLIQENQQLRNALDAANQRIKALEANQFPLPTSTTLPAPTTPKSSGSDASKYAATTPQTTPTTPSPKASPVSFASVAAKNKDTKSKTTKTMPHKQKAVISRHKIQVIARSFTLVSETAGYQYIYLPRRYREPISNIRTKLRSLSIDNARILDVFYPTRRVVGLLLHNDYIPIVLDILTKAGITPLSDFNPRDEAHLCDPKHAQLPPADRTAMITTIHTTHLLRTLKRIRPDVRPAVLRAFIECNWLTATQYDDYINELATNNNSQPPTLVDTEMSDIPTESLSTLAPPSPTGDGQPAEDQL